MQKKNTKQNNKNFKLGQQRFKKKTNKKQYANNNFKKEQEHQRFQKGTTTTSIATNNRPTKTISRQKNNFKTAQQFQNREQYVNNDCNNNNPSHLTAFCAISASACRAVRCLKAPTAGSVISSRSPALMIVDTKYSTAPS